MDDIHMTPTAERILSVASELFYTRGIRAVGVDTIALAAETTKKTLYDLFADLAEGVGLRDPRALADQLLLVHEGALVGSSVAELDTTIYAARAAVRTLIEAHR